MMRALVFRRVTLGLGHPAKAHNRKVVKLDVQPHTPSSHHKNCAPMGPTLGTYYSITISTTRCPGHPTLGKHLVQCLLAIRIGSTKPT